MMDEIGPKHSQLIKRQNSIYIEESKMILVSMNGIHILIPRQNKYQSVRGKHLKISRY